MEKKDSLDSYKLISLNPDKFCGVCTKEQNFSKCGCCTICWMLICPGCQYINSCVSQNPLYTVCKKKNCIYIHKLIHKMFRQEIAVIIAQKLHQPNDKVSLIFNNFPKKKDIIVDLDLYQT